MSRASSLQLGVWFTALLCACGGTKTLEPVYQGCSTDENWQTIDDYRLSGRVKSDAALAPQWLAPPPQATPVAVSAATALSLRWAASAAVPGTDDGDVTCAAALLPGVSTLLAPHEPPISGSVYDVQLKQAGVVTYRVLTTKQVTVIPAAALAGSVGQDLSVDMVGAKLLSNDVVQGPYQAAPLTLRVSK